jgi:replicative DNA helicase
MHSLPTLFDELTSRIEAMRAGNETPYAVPSGMKDLDRVLYGFQQGKLYVIAGKPGAGTTAFMINLVHNILFKVNPLKKVAVFSLDFSSRIILEKLLACTTEIWLEKIIRGKLKNHEWKKLQQQGINPILASPLSLEDGAAMSVIDIAGKCEELINGNGLDILFIDNLQQIIKEKGQNPDEETVKTMRSLRDLARTKNIPIVVLSRWNSTEENKPGKKRKPQLSDMQDTGIIGQEADALLFLYRPEYDDITEDESGESLRGVTCIKIAKNRMGPLDTIRMKALSHIQKFEEQEYNDPFSYKGPAKRSRRSNK